MKPYERFLTALELGTPDRVPIFEHLFSPKLQERIIGYRSELYDGKAIIKLATKLGIDSTVIPIGGFCGFLDNTDNNKLITDEWGVEYIKEGWPIVVQIKNPIKNRKDWEKYVMPDPLKPERSKRLADAVKANDNDIGIILGVLGPVTMVYWYLMGILDMSLAIKDDPNLILEITDKYAEWVIKASKNVSKIKGFHAFMVSDDWGYKNSLLISPEYLRKYFFKSFRKIVRGLKEFGFPVIMHNDGNLWEIINELVDTGINAYHPIEKAASMDLKIIKDRYGDRICPIGNVNNKEVMVSGTVEDVRKETLECLKIGGPGGGYIISTDHSLHDDIPEKNVWSFINTVKEFGKYPLKIK